MSGGGEDLTCPVLEDGVWGHSCLDLSEDVLECLEADGLPVKLQLSQALVVLHQSAVPIQVVGGAVLQTHT